jgi:hypothetical protein
MEYPLYSKLNNDSLKHLYESLENNLTLIKVINKTIVCGEVSNITIKEGDSLIIKRSSKNNPQYEICLINEIQINNISHKKIDIAEKQSIGLTIEKNAKDNCEFKILPVNSSY